MRLEIAPADLRPIVQAVLAEALQALEADRAKLDGRLAYTEPQAAAAIGVRPHVLRDARLRGEIIPTRIGQRIGYERTELLAYLARNRFGGQGE